MKILTLSILFFSVNIYGQQFHKPGNWTRSKKPEKPVKRVEITYVQDTSETPYTFYETQLYNTQGQLEVVFMIMPNGDTIERCRYTYPDSLSIYATYNLEDNPAYYKIFYNAKGFMEKRVRYFSPELGEYTELYTYNKKDQLVRITETHGGKTDKDSLIYSNGKLTKVFSWVSYKREPDFMVYTYYPNGNLEKIITYTQEEKEVKVSDIDVFTYNSANQVVKQVSDHYFYSEYVKDSKFTDVNTYYQNEKIKKSEATYKSGDEIRWIMIYEYGEDGEVARFTHIDNKAGGKVVATYKIYYQ